MKVCRIELSGSERSRIKQDVEEILQYFNSISEVDTKNVKDAYHAVDRPGSSCAMTNRSSSSML